MNAEFQQDKVHFDLGVDRLANAQEMQQMSEPWAPSVSVPTEPRSPQGISLPEDDLEPWASSLELPGMEG